MPAWLTEPSGLQLVLASGPEVRFVSELEEKQAAVQISAFPRYLPPVNALRRNMTIGPPVDINTLMGSPIELGD